MLRPPYKFSRELDNAGEQGRIDVVTQFRLFFALRPSPGKFASTIGEIASQEAKLPDRPITFPEKAAEADDAGQSFIHYSISICNYY
jgi:hypothetical protein